MPDRFIQWDAMVRRQRELATTLDAYQAHLRELAAPPPVHCRDYAVDETSPKLTWWGRVKLLWRIFW